MKIMDIYLKTISMLDTYKNGSINFQKNFRPLLYDFKNIIETANDKNKAEDMYFKKLYDLCDNYTLDLKYAKKYSEERSLFYNLPVSFHYIINYINDIKNHVYTIENQIEKKIYEYEEISNQYNQSIKEEIKEINNLINDYKKTNVYSNFNEDASSKIKVLKEMDEYIEDIEKKSFTLSMKNEIPINSFIGQNYPTDFRKSPELKGFLDLIEKSKIEFKNYIVDKQPIADISEILTLIDKVDEIFAKIYIKLRNCGYKSCMADMFIDNNKSDSITGFLKNKNEADNIKYNYQLPEWSSFKNVLVFSDNSILAKKNNENYYEFISKKDVIDIRKKMINDYIGEEFKKKPTISKKFKKMNELIYLEYFNSLQKIVEKYKTNEEVLKNYEFDIYERFESLKSEHKNSYRLYEKIDDEISSIIKNHKVNQFIKSIASNKYIHLYNEDTHKIGEEIYNLNLPDNSLQDYIGKKIAAFKTPEEFNKALKTFLNSFNSFTMDATLNKVEKFGGEVISENDNILILKINNFEESKAIGSASWCISRDESYFKSYADNREQYFLFNFNKESTDCESMIGVTLEKNGDFNIAHYKDDSDCEEDDELVEYLKEEVEFFYSIKNKSKLKLT